MKYVFFLLPALALGAGVDDTLIERKFGADVTEAVVRKITRTSVFPFDQGFLRRLAFVETFDGEDTKTYRPGYFGGIWQVDENLFNLTKGLGQPIYDEIRTRWGINWGNVTWNDLLKPFYSGLGARLYLQHLNNQNYSIPGTIDTQAQYWVDHYRPGGTVDFFKQMVRRLESDPVCEGLMDICIVLDRSTSIGGADFQKARQFVADLIYTFSYDSARVAVVTYGTEAAKVFDFMHQLSLDGMRDAVNNITYPDPTGGNTNTPAGINMAVDFYEQIRPRNGIPQVLTTFTDGLHNRGNLPEAIMRARRANLTSFSVGIGSAIDYSELLNIAYLNPTRVFTVNDYDALAEFFYQMNSATCEVPQCPPIGQSQNGTLKPLEKRYFRFDFPESDSGNGLVGLKVNVSAPGILGWYSYSEETPNSAVHDGVISNGLNEFLPLPLPPKGRQEEPQPEPEVPGVYITLQAPNITTTTSYDIIAEKHEPTQQTTEPPTVPPTEETTPNGTPSLGQSTILLLFIMLGSFLREIR